MEKHDLLTTKEAAKLLRISPTTLLSNHCRQGEYFGIKPLKMPSRHLVWRRSDIEAAIQRAGENR